MRALVTNDDGIDSPGLHALARVASSHGLDVLVAAPHAERSGSSASLAGLQSQGRLLVDRRQLPDLDEITTFSVEATPAYIAWAAIRGAFHAPVDVVLSGINRGPNTGHAVLHSGTVGAALTAQAHGLPALAVSVNAADPKHWDTAASVASRALGWLLKQPTDDPTVLNVNLPDIPSDALRGLVRAPLATFGAVQADIGEIGEGFVTMTFSDVDVSTEPGTDAGLQTEGWATVTPLLIPSEATHVSLDGLVDGDAPTSSG